MYKCITTNIIMPFEVVNCAIIDDDGSLINYTYVTLQLIGLLGADNLRCVPHVAAHALHPVQVLLVEHLFQNGNIKIINIVNLQTQRDAECVS